MKFRRRQLILAALVVALGTAVYLNWQFSDDKGLIATDILQPQRELGEARFVNNSKVPEDINSDETSNAQVEQVANMSDETKEYFAQAKVNRQKARDEATELIKNVTSDVQATDQAKAEAIKQAGELSDLIQKESNIESLLKAKGFDECLVFIQNGECSVVISPNKLNDNTAVTIFDIVSGQTGIPYDKIKIVEAK